jgi:hypothetical protein
MVDGIESVAKAVNGNGFQIPEYTQILITYYGTTNNIQTVVYKNNGATVATLTLNYSVQPPTANDANITSVTIAY